MLVERHGDKTRVACIGPGGERLVRYAAIVSGRRTASRCGVGAVMGSKNLKAIAITTGRNVRVSDPEGFKKLASEQARLFRESGQFREHKEWGTTATQNVTNSIGIFPTRNFRYGQLKDCAKIYGEEYRKLRTGDFGCYNCSARCGKAHRVKTGPYAGAYSEGPEYESIWAFTAPIDSTSIEASIRADQLCDDLGIDTISAGNSVALAYELYEHGIIDRKDTDGMELVYGDHQTMVKLIRKIGLREGFGSILAEGVVRASRIIGRGAEAYAIHAKGMELPAYEPRGAKSHGFNYATSNIGGSHCYGYAAQEVFGVPSRGRSTGSKRQRTRTSSSEIRTAQRPAKWASSAHSRKAGDGTPVTSAAFWPRQRVSSFLPTRTSSGSWGKGSSTSNVPSTYVRVSAGKTTGCLPVCSTSRSIPSARPARVRW